MSRNIRKRTLSSNQSNHRNSFTKNLFQLGNKGYEVGDDDLSVDDLIIVVMGPTGSGKSSFIEVATGMVGIAGHGLQSFTSKISVIKLAYPGVNLCFVDTPGFDDTTTSDLDIFKLISNWLVKTYGKDIRLTGLLYFHRISDNRVAGTSLKNLHLFEKLCGENFNNIVLTTTMWDDVDEPVGAQREQELVTEFWGPMIERGASVKRFLYTRESAFEILLPIFDKVDERSSRALLIQNEINDHGLPLKDTSAGKTLYMKLGELVARHQEVLGRIRKELKDPTSDADQLRLLMEDYQIASMQLQRASEDMRKMKTTRLDWVRQFTIGVDWTKFTSIFLFNLRSRKELSWWREEQTSWRENHRTWLEDQRWRQEHKMPPSTEMVGGIANSTARPGVDGHCRADTAGSTEKGGRGGFLGRRPGMLRWISDNRRYTIP